MNTYLFNIELNLYKTATSSKDKWYRLERLHIIGQLHFETHLKVHYWMLQLALKENLPKEIFGQLIRLVLVFPGHLIGKLPVGNPGTTRYSAFSSIEVPEDLK